MKSMLTQYSRMEATVSLDVDTLLRQWGIPTDLESASRLAGIMLPIILDYRRNMYRAESELITNEFPGIELAPLAFYPQAAIETLVRVAAGLTPRPQLTEIEYYDEQSQRMARERVAPWVYPGEEQALKAMSNRLQAGSARHIKSASRELITDTATLNGMGWARQLSGSENCSFCAMLASRGAVYSKESVRFRTHNNCDCTATIVRDQGAAWEGKEESEELYRIWKKSDGLAGFRENLQDRKN